MGTLPRRSSRTLAWLLSTQTTSFPDSAKQAPATRPTYPVPTTAIRIDLLEDSLYLLSYRLRDADSRRLPPCPARAHRCRRVHPHARRRIHGDARRRRHALHELLERSAVSHGCTRASRPSRRSACACLGPELPVASRSEWPYVEMLAGETDVVHAAHPLLIPARRAAQVVTIHDLFFLLQSASGRAPKSAETMPSCRRATLVGLMP